MPTLSKKKVCLHCGKEYAESSFYSHRNELINEQFGFCKKCVKTNINLDNLSTLSLFLQTMDIPYLKEFWKISNEDEKETIGMYFKNMALKQNIKLHFKDGDSLEGVTNKAELTVIDNEDFDLTEEIVRRWGRNLPLEDYIYLEDEFDGLGGNNPEVTSTELLLMKNICKTSLALQKAYEEEDTAKIEKMSKTLSSQMNDAQIKPVQVKGQVDNGMKNWGEWVRHIEEDEPVAEDYERFQPKFIMDYVDRYFVKQLKRVFGRASDKDIEDLNKEGFDGKTS